MNILEHKQNTVKFKRRHTPRVFFLFKKKTCLCVYKNAPVENNCNLWKLGMKGLKRAKDNLNKRACTFKVFVCLFLTFLKMLIIQPTQKLPGNIEIITSSSGPHSCWSIPQLKTCSCLSPCTLLSHPHILQYPAQCLACKWCPWNNFEVNEATPLTSAFLYTKLGRWTDS